MITGTLDDELRDLALAMGRRELRQAIAEGTAEATANRLARSWDLWDAPADVHMAFAEAGVDPVEDAELWGFSSLALSRAPQWGKYLPAGAAVRDTEAMQRAFDEQLERRMQQAFSGVQAARAGVNPEPLEQTMAKAIVFGTADQEQIERDYDYVDTEALGKYVDAYRKQQERNSGGILNRLADNPIARFGGSVLSEIGDTAIVDDVLEPLVNTGVQVLDFGYQMTQAQFRRTLQNVRDRGFVSGVATTATENPLNPAFFGRAVAGDGAGALTGALQTGGQTGIGTMAMDIGEEIGAPNRASNIINVAETLGLTARPADFVAPGVNIGEGFFYSGPGEQRRQQFERVAAAPINGQVPTIGRWAASGLFDAGTRPYTILSGLTDAAIAVAGPAEVGIDSAARGMKAARAFQTVGTNPNAGVFERAFIEWGGLRGVRNTVDTGRVQQFLRSDEGTRLWTRIAETTDSFQIDRWTRGQLPLDRVRQLADETDPLRVREVLADELGVNITRHPIDPAARRPFTIDALRDRAPTMTRLMAEVPDGHVNLEDGRRLLDDVETFLTNTQASTDTIRRWHNRFARTEARPERYQLLEEMMTETSVRIGFDSTDDLWPRVRAWADESGVDEDEVWRRVTAGEDAPTGIEDVDATIRAARDHNKQFTRMFTDLASDGTEYNISYISGERINDWITVDGKVTQVPSDAHLYVEHIGTHVPMPDPVKLRQLFSKHRNLLLKDNGDMRLPRAFYQQALDIQNGIWKPAVLFRLAWPVRVIGEEQVRMAASANPSLVRHPAQHIAVMLGNYSWFKKAGRLSQDATGDAWQLMDEHAAALARGSADWRQVRRGVARTDSRTVRPSQSMPSDVVREAWADEIAKLTADPFVNVLMRSESLDQAVETAMKMREYRMAMRAAHDTDVIDLATEDGVRRYLQTIGRRVDELTNGSPELAEAIGRGQLGDVPIIADRARGQVNGAFRARLGDFEPPAFLPFRETSPLRASDESTAMWDRVVETAFGWLMARPTNLLSRSPTFRQEYWKRVIEQADRLDPQHADTLLRNAEGARLRRGDLRQLRYRANRPGGEWTIDDLDTYAKSWALDHTQNLLFDMSKRNQFFDIAKLIFPFGDAWMEVLTRWARLSVENPNIIRRAEQVISQGREMEGYIYENENGEEVFNYPGSEHLVGALSGLRVPLTGRLAGLSLATELAPGVGPVAQMPLSLLVPNAPEWDWLNDALFPFGRPDWSGDLTGTAWDQIPPSWRRVLNGIAGPQSQDEQRVHVSNVAYLASQLAASGDYDVYSGDPDTVQAEWTRLFNDAQDAAGRFSIARGLFQFGAPSAPSPDWLLEDETGERLRIATLREMYQKSFETNPDNPIGEFINNYGPAALLAVQGRTISLVPGRGLPPTKEAERWSRENPDLVDTYPFVYSFFAPQGGEFDYSAYDRILGRQGEREALTVDQYVARYLHTLGTVAYNEKRAEVEERVRQQDPEWDGGLMPTWARRYMRDYDTHLTQVYSSSSGGYAGRGNTPGGIPQAAGWQEALPQLQAIINDPAVASNPLTDAIRRYMDARQTVEDRFVSEGNDTTDWTSSNAGAPYRAFLVDTAAFIADDVPEFTSVFEAIFEREMSQGLTNDEQREEE